MRGQWNWWFATDAGLVARIAIGGAIFAALAVADLLRHGRSARRWREYVFLLAVVAAAMGYGIANDWIASGISWEYFVYGKGVSMTARMPWAACLIGMKASFSAGLVVGVAMLMANNPREGRRQLRYRELFQWLAVVLAIAVTGAVVGAGVGWRGGWNWMSGDLAAIWREGMFRPRRFMAAYGMNLGGYAGAAVGTIAAVVGIVRRRAG
jgi:hypothetical protein